MELEHTTPAKAVEELADFRGGTVALAWNGLLHARKTAAPFSSLVDAVRRAYTVLVAGLFLQNSSSVSCQVTN